MADPEPGTDSTAGATTPAQGTDAPANDQTGAAAPPATSLDDDFVKRLEAVDPTTLPQSVRQKLETPFKSDYTRKTQELAEERKRFDVERQTTFDAVRKIIEAKNAQTQGASPEEERHKELLDLAAAGDAKALQELVRMEATRLVQPVQTQMALRTAAETAMNASPYVKANWNQIISTIEGDPVLKEICTAQNYKYADKVMIALGLEIQARDLAGKLESRTKEYEAAMQKIAALERERTAGLPSSTSKAGTSTGVQPGSQPSGFMNIAKAAFLAQGGREEDWR